ncbi:capsule biosynthesis protein [Roseateles sp. BYS180W]|uniref:Capsule biosynthesis protein n=1 Tax=Roseateles rivi TaxID=3299028 RepID=A0ABW7FZD4_9BURK
MTPSSLAALQRQRRVLLLQGPMGPFFSKLADFLRGNGADVFKLNFNGGDRLYYPAGEDFVDDPRALTAELHRRVDRDRIDAIALFGQSRPIHKVAIEAAKELGIEIYVFEEGYLRPNFITLERGGVNALSLMPRDDAYYRARVGEHLPKTHSAGQTFWRTAAIAMLYAIARHLHRSRYPKEQFHRDLHPLREGLRWLRGGLRKVLHSVTERNVLWRLCRSEQRFFLLALQVHNDAQIQHHSPFDDVHDVIAHTIESFATCAPKDAALVIKHHPMDRAYRHYGAYIQEQARKHGVADRVISLHDVHLPTLLRLSRGLVTVNSTTGLQSLHHGTPVFLLGEAHYNIPGLVHQGDLPSFWLHPDPVDPGLYRAYRKILMRTSQINASFYADTPALNKAGASRTLQLHTTAPKPARPAATQTNERLRA